MVQDIQNVLFMMDKTTGYKDVLAYAKHVPHFSITLIAGNEDFLSIIEQVDFPYHIAFIDACLQVKSKLGVQASGVDLARILKSLHPAVDIIILTDGDEQTVCENLEPPEFHFTAKPVYPENIFQLLDGRDECDRLSREIRKNQILKQLLNLSPTLFSAQDMQSVLELVLHGVHDAIGLDRVRLYLLSEDGQAMVGAAHTGMSDNFLGLTIPIADAPYLQELMRNPKTQIFTKKPNQPVPFEYKLAKESVEEWLCAPLCLGKKIIGNLAADNKVSQHPIDEASTEALSFLATQAAKAIENARVRQQETAVAAREAERRARNLKALQDISRKISSLLDIDKILESTCEAAVNLFGVEHSGLVLFDKDQAQGKVVAEFPSLGTQGQIIPVSGIPAEENLIIAREPVVFSDVSQASSLGNIRNVLKQIDVRSILIVPVVIKDRVLGSFSLDAVGHSFQFSEETIELCQTFAAQVAIAVENAQALAETKRRNHLLSALDEASRHIRGDKETSKLLHEIVRMAVELIGFSVGGLYDNHPNLGELELTATYPYASNEARSRVFHGQSVIGIAAQTGEMQIGTQSGDSPVHRDGNSHGTAIGLPLKKDGEVEAVLYLATSNNAEDFDHSTLEVLERFGMQASIALHTSKLMHREQRIYGQLAILHKISDYIQATSNLNSILHMVLTGVTAGYGLGFNRAALFLLDEEKENLIGKMGIGHLDATSAHQDWEQDNRRGLFDFAHYIDRLERDGFPATPIGQGTLGLKLPIDPSGEDAFSSVIVQKRYRRITSNELGQLPTQFVKMFKPASPLILIPLITRKQVIGILAADNKFTQSPITSDDIESLMTLAATAAVTIDNTQLLAKTEQGRIRFRDSFEASNALVSHIDPRQVLQQIVEQAYKTANADGVSIYLVSEVTQPRDLITVGTTGQYNRTEELVRPDGLSMQVIRTGRPAVIRNAYQEKDRVNPNVFSRGIVAALCLPFSVEGKRVGVMWFHYKEARAFSEAEIEALQLYANQSAIVYDSAQRIKEVEYLRRAATAMASASAITDVLTKIVESACNVLDADSAVIWSYDAVRNKFILEHSVAIGIPLERWKEFQKVGPRAGGTGFTIIDRKWIGVTDITDRIKFPFVGENTRSLLHRMGARSFQGVALSAGGENLGVLYVNYKGARQFNEKERQMAQIFANHAALTLRNAKLLNQVSKARDTAKVVAEVTALEDVRDNRLSLIAERTRDALDCDAITLYIYDQNKGKLEYPAIMAGVDYPDRASPLSQISKDSVVLKVLRRQHLYKVEDITTDPLFQHTRFAKDEKIKSCIAIPLIVGVEKVGVMFVNYRQQHRFTKDEETNIELFAYQAAVAVRNTQLYQKVQKQVNALHLLHSAGRAVTSSLKQEEILSRIAEQVYKLMDISGKDIRFSHIALVENNILQFEAAYPPQHLPSLRQGIGIIDLKNSERVGIAGEAVKSGKPVLANDVTQFPSYICYDDLTRSELSVPIKSGDQVIGVINVEHSAINAFEEADLQVLESLAAQASVAIENARTYRESEQLREVAEALVSTLDQPTLLELITSSAMELTNTNSSSILFWDAQKEEFTDTFETKGPENKPKRYKSHVRSRGGIARYIIDTKKPVIISDTCDDPRVSKVAIRKGRRALIGVPLLNGSQVIGVLYINDTRARQFSEHQVTLLKTLGSMATVSIERERQYKELTHTKGLVEARTTLAWMGMMNNTWRHAIEGHAVTIRDEVQMLSNEIRQSNLRNAERRLTKIMDMAGLIMDKPITPPLAEEEGVESVPISALLYERLRQLWENEPYKSVRLSPRDYVEATTTVRASPAWLIRIFDLLIDNAVTAVAGCARKEIKVTVKAVALNVKIIVADTGPGIPEEIRPILFRRQIKKPKGSKGLGSGLLMAQTIAQTYGGKVEIGDTSPKGTKMVITLPIETP